MVSSIIRMQLREEIFCPVDPEERIPEETDTDYKQLQLNMDQRIKALGQNKQKEMLWEKGEITKIAAQSI